MEPEPGSRSGQSPWKGGRPPRAAGSGPHSTTEEGAGGLGFPWDTTGDLRRDTVKGLAGGPRPPLDSRAQVRRLGARAKSLLFWPTRDPGRSVSTPRRQVTFSKAI